MQYLKDKKLQGLLEIKALNIFQIKYPYLFSYTDSGNLDIGINCFVIFLFCVLGL